ncbi:olfactory receptor 1571-like [Ailuropoda melanoleuca]|uniref:olfactory receptor 1571-like n=1 Tax=Ailuropoda melanoleuca TaxID=9646 RepID=UPI00149496D5|nr:olfactory receptor 1571-like [Ailuropoda melanoleuca]
MPDFAEYGLGRFMHGRQETENQDRCGPIGLCTNTDQNPKLKMTKERMPPRKTPMYFFLANLSFVDICFTSTTIPKMLVNIQTHSKVITYTGCISQICFSLLFAGWDDILLTVMAYDRFVAICHPLHYTVIMNPRLCGLLALLSCIISVLNSLLQSLMLLQLSFCSEVEIPHFFCELNQMIQLACSDTFLNDTVIYVSAVLLAGAPLAGILCSYSKIISSICGISSAQGNIKAFSTCASHLSVVSLFYCTVLGVYLSSAVTQSSHASAVASVMYMVVSPMLNPFIYTLRNRDIKEALIRFFRRATIKGTIVLVRKIQNHSFHIGSVVIPFYSLIALLDDTDFIIVFFKSQPMDSDVSCREIVCLQVGGAEGNDPNEQTEPAVNTPLLQSRSTGNLRLDKTWSSLVLS